MTPSRNGAIHLFHFAGINVFLHWSWFLMAVFMVSRQTQGAGDHSVSWGIYEYLALFCIVLLHEFGHSLACRSVGGRADQIVLWPLGGVAYVDPPQRPGATLWSIVAGPLVNVLLLPIFIMVLLVARALHWPETNPNLYNFILVVIQIDVGLFCFNMLPVYPLDGGQILRSLLWFFLGRARSLMVSSVIGGVAVVIFVILAINGNWTSLMAGFDRTWLAVILCFVLMNCWTGLQHARALARVAAAPRRPGLACPRCHTAPPIGNFWACGRCRASFDMFATRGVCPNCGTIFNATRCLECGEPLPLQAFGNLDA